MHWAAQVPQGATPRNLTVHLRGALTRTAKPGDAVTVAGVFLPEPFTGFRAMRAGLLTSVYLQARCPIKGCRASGLTPHVTACSCIVRC